ncbi:IS3 family transposase, partial [Aeromonas media]|uniref:IS3 family transposase n=1 Tax=Aeromonas media TaxID=651 RepID=UPI003994BDD2
FGMQTSMSRKGNCFDNAPIESFWGALKNELVHHHRFKTRAEAKAAIQEYIEIFYNRQRRHSRLGNISPAEFNKRYWKTAQAAGSRCCSLFLVELGASMMVASTKVP